MKKTLSLLLALCMIVCLCACGSSAPQPAAEAGTADAAESDAAEAGETPAEPEPEPEKVYKTEDRLVLVKEAVKGHRLPYSSATVTGRIFDEVIEYHYDEFGQLTGTEEKLEYPDVPDFFFAGEENERYAYSYTDEGELESVTMDAGSFNGFERRRTYRLEGGKLAEERTFYVDGDETIEQTVYTYGSAGLPVSQVTTQYLDFYGDEYENPVIDTYEFDAAGYCTRWESRCGEQFNDLRYTYDEDGNITRLEVKTQDNDQADLMEIHYENGVQTKLTRTQNGESVDLLFAYRDDGLPESTSWDAEGHHIDVLYTYNDDGYLAEADWRADDESIGTTTYTYSTEDDGDVRCEIRGNRGPAILGDGTIESVAFTHDYTGYNGKLYSAYSYELKPVLSSLRYVEKHISYDYETIPVKVEIDPASCSALDSIDALYPVLRDSYGGHPVPVPDGSRRLSKVQLLNGDQLQVVAEPVYDADGTLISCTNYFDGVSSASVWSNYHPETDDQGRLIKLDFDSYTVSFDYAEDEQSYTFTRTYSDGNTYEQEYLLSDMAIPNIVRKSLDELCYGTLTFNEDGLPSQGVYTRRDADGNETSETEVYTYEYELAEDGTILSLSVRTDGRDYASPILRFDEHGYLTDYSITFRNSYHFMYSYIDA